MVDVRDTEVLLFGLKVLAFSPALRRALVTIIVCPQLRRAVACRRVGRGSLSCGCGALRLVLPPGSPDPCGPRLSRGASFTSRSLVDPHCIVRCLTLPQGR